MAPSRPQPSRSSSRASSQYFDDADERQAQQAGRSSANIAAQASAHALRESSRPNSRGPSRSSSTPNLLRKSRPQAQVNTNVEPTPESAPSVRSSNNVSMPRQAPPHVPALPAPLESIPSTSSSGTLRGRNDSDEGAASASSSSDSAPRSRPRTAAGAALAAQLTASGSQTPIPRPSSFLRPPEMSHNDSSLSLTRQTTPKTVRDLGSDYTRYFNPWASPNTSQQNLGTPLPRQDSSSNLLGVGAAGVSSADLQKRLSDPFGDTKRLENPFDSRQNTAPSTPQQTKQADPDLEKGVAISATEVPMATTKPGTPNFIRDADPEKAAFFPYMDDRLGAPDYAFPLFSDQKEDDDELHMPQWDDDKRLKPKFKDHFTRENIVSTLGLLFMMLGLLCIFVVLPVVSYTGTSLLDYSYETPLDQMPQTGNSPEAWAIVNNNTYPLMENMRTGLVDPDTPTSAKTRKGVNGDEYILVFSDEFNAKNRSFYPGDDPYWSGLNAWYGATQDLEWYDPDALNTGDGTLQIQLDAFANHGLDYRSGMLQSWNQACFKGGIFEVGMSLPGPAGVHGYWPGVWTMGNLGRPGYLATTDGLWPYTYDECDVGITPNQSSPDGISELPGQRLPSCPCAGEDHPTPGTGRGAPEIDIAEVSADWAGEGWAVATQSFQVAPFDIYYYPNYEFMETPQYNLSYVNTYTGGPFQEAVSTTSMLNNAWYDGKEYQKYAYEYAPGGNDTSFIAWTIGDDETMKFDARAVGPNGNIGQRLISEEPMSMVLNLGFSHSWVDIDFANLVFPTVMRIDYVRWYQKEDEQMVTCDPPGYETTEYIANHPLAYNNPNLNHWSDAGYSQPRNTLMNGCSA
ncbi:hypothetical protein LTR85_004819 [Meristemomyces frigidus]|nr:hypothetical protein LTR85_004819 [Meristemomyces frigidus]